MARLQGKTAVITGGNSGIGLATARRFVEEGAYVFITGRRQAELDKAVSEIGRNVTAVQGDTSNPDDIDRLYREVEAKRGKVDIVFANAGVAEQVPTLETNPETYDKMFDINARGVFFTVQKALPLMKDGGSVILNGSVAGRKGIPTFAAYSATKAALQSFVRTWTSEFSGRGIRANVISPGPIDTPIFETQYDSKEKVDEVKQQYKALVPMGRLGRPEEIASVAVFLASDESSYVTGVDLAVDGGIAAV